jgi:hypothetical protein
VPAGLIAVVAGVAGALGWVATHVDDDVVWLVGRVLVSLLGSGWCFYGVVSAGIAWVIAFGFDDQIADDAAGYIFTALALVPIALELAWRDAKSRRRCVDCLENIHADANICKHCGYRYETAPELPPRTQ